nr:hypothetical protein Ade03nite_60430 [Actinoplanes derwentensis]
MAAINRERSHRCMETYWLRACYGVNGPAADDPSLTGQALCGADAVRRRLGIASLPRDPPHRA